MIGVAFAGGVAVIGATALAATYDLVSRVIPNWISLGLAAGFAGFASFGGASDPVLEHLAAGAAVLAGGFALFAAGWMGGGDVKLAAAVALWLGPQLTPIFLAATMLAGGALALAVLARRAATARPEPTAGLTVDAAPRERGIPYAVAIAAGAAFAAHRAPWLLAGS